MSEGILTKIAPAGHVIRIAPGGEPLVPWPPHLPLPLQSGVFEWAACGDGQSYQPKLRLHNWLVRMRVNVGELFGLGISYNALRRLMSAGFVPQTQTTPGAFSFDLRGFWQHAERVRTDPTFWDEANTRRYMEAIG